MILLFESLAHLDVIYESKILNFIPSEILEELEHLWSENYIPDLTKLFDIILPFIHSEKGIPIVKSATDRYLLKINYFGTSDNKMEYRSGKIYEILESLSDPLLDENALVQMKEDYEFSLLEDSITIDMAKFMRILLRWQQKDRESIRRLIVVCFYLWNKIPEAKALLKILFYLSKDDILQVIHIIPRLIYVWLGSKLIDLYSEGK